MNRKRLLFTSLVIALLVCGCGSRREVFEVGSFEPESNRFWEVISRSSYVERMGIAFRFTEGPAWHPGGYLIFSDIQDNAIYMFTGRKYEVYRKPSNHSNGLSVEPGGDLLACEQETRRITRTSPEGIVTVVADRYLGRRLNSPNDLCLASDGTIYFTDPAYGLPGGNEDPGKELPFSGVFRVKGRSIEVIDSTLSWPNGIALSPDESTLYVANTEFITVNGNEQHQMYWMRYNLDEQGSVVDKSIFYVAENSTLAGGPDGLEVDSRGYLFMTGPGGILVVDTDGELLGRIGLPRPASNLEFGPREKVLYITAGTTLYKMAISKLAG